MKLQKYNLIMISIPLQTDINTLMIFKNSLKANIETEKFYIC